MFTKLNGTMSNLKYLLLTGLSTFFIITFIILFFCGIIIIFIYFALDIIIFNRTRQLEEILPDFFEVVSSNLKGGLSFERSLWLGIKPRFGILSQEIAIASKKVMTGCDVDEALTEFVYKYDSPMLKRSIDLIISELHEGGKISEIIERIVVDLKKTKELKAEMIASVLSYIIFISIIVIVVSPIIFALSLNLLGVIQSIMGVLAKSMGSGSNPLGITFSTIPLDPNDFVIFSYIALAVIAVFASMIISIIEKGSIKGGIKYIIIFLVFSEILYMIFSYMMSLVFGNMFAF
jgi:pilus assembly protein TadC